MREVKIVGCGVDTLVLNINYADKQFQPIKQELDQDLQDELQVLQNEARENEAPLVTRWAFKGIHLFMQEKGSRGQWRWILRSPLLSLAISRGRLSRIIAQVRLSSEYLWSCEDVAQGIVDAAVFLYDLFGDYLWLQVSQIDLCTDVVRRRWKRMATLDFGKYTSRISCCIYRKSAEVSYKALIS